MIEAKGGEEEEEKDEEEEAEVESPEEKDNVMMMALMEDGCSDIGTAIRGKISDSLQ